MADIKIVLTFDDGPAAGLTDKVLAALNAPGEGLDPIKAAFFVQTHSPIRMATDRGRGLVKQAFEADHVIGIHTGSTIDHACHKKRVILLPDVLPPELGKPKNGLESDMIRAKVAITKLTAATPKYVRATYGYTNADCMAVYGRTLLKHIHWDVDSGDSEKGSKTPEKINAKLEKAIVEKIRNGRRDLIILFHDVQSVTVDNLEEFIQTIRIAAENAELISSPAPVRKSSSAAIASSVSTAASSVDGGTKTSSQTIPLSSTATASDAGVSKNNVIFTGSRDEIEDIFDRRTGPGDNLPCPPHLP
jgi:peptidoglycan/xylan/chitin deacetylase (PgdA/CDA1 family)